VTAVHTRSPTEAALEAAAGGCAFDFACIVLIAIGRGRFDPVNVGA
jgi:hypothetical protein